jgi:phosphoribosylaminoimidazolecarboxamide formyltransferase/IMP cyclohydrolase
VALGDIDEQMAAAAEHEVEFVDLVCVNLYPFEQTAARRGATEHEVIENIDIGGPTMIRAAAKNFAFTAVVVNPASYDAVIAELKDAGGKLSLGTRESLAAEAFSYTARYDSAISRSPSGWCRRTSSWWCSRAICSSSAPRSWPRSRCA